MLKIILILGMGALLGYYQVMPKKVKKYTSLIQNIALLFMLFMLGAKIGLDKEILGSIGEIGAIAFVFALSSIVFSVIGIRYIAKPFINYSKKDVGESRSDS